jgi:hypothetical protein
MANELTLKQASEHLGLSRERVRMLLINGELSGRHESGCLLIQTQSAIEWAIRSADWRVGVARQKLKVAHDALRRAEERKDAVQRWAKEEDYGSSDGVRG